MANEKERLRMLFDLYMKVLKKKYTIESCERLGYESYSVVLLSLGDRDIRMYRATDFSIYYLFNGY